MDSKINLKTDTRYQCVECGVETRELYTKMKAGIIKVSFCTDCDQITDKYILCDPVIMLLDALLHKPQVYRHLLHNIHIPSPWKLFVIFLLCDTYFKWDNLHSSGTDNGNETTGFHNPIFYAAWEIDFYRMSCVALCEWICFVVVLLLGLKCVLLKSTSVLLIVAAVVVSSFGKLLTIPAIVWGQTHSIIYLRLTQLFVFTSNVTALRVLCRSSRLVTICLVAVSWYCQHLTGQYIIEKLNAR